MIKAKKSLGQNFLNDSNIINKIISLGKLDSDTTVIEVGPGMGALTKEMTTLSKKVIAIEIDKRAIEYLEEKNYKNFELLHGDFLKLDSEQVENSIEGRVVMISNVPYYITTPIIMKALMQYNKISEVIIMVQKEVAERITAKPGVKAYGSLSVFCQLIAEVKYEFTVSKNVFIPKPKIDSAIISFKKIEHEYDLKYLEKVLKICFMQKRKTLLNNILKGGELSREEILTIFEKLNISASARAEELEPIVFVKIMEELKNF